MDLAAVMDEVTGKLSAAIPDLNPFAYPPETAEPTAGITSYPDRIDFGQSYKNGLSRIEGLPVVILVGAVSHPDTRNDVAQYVKGSGSKSVRQILETGPYTSFDTLKVTDCEFSTYTEAAVTYLAATFHCDITGTGS